MRKNSVQIKKLKVLINKISGTNTAYTKIGEV